MIPDTPLSEIDITALNGLKNWMMSPGELIRLFVIIFFKCDERSQLTL